MNDDELEYLIDEFNGTFESETDNIAHLSNLLKRAILSESTSLIKEMQVEVDKNTALKDGCIKHDSDE